MEKKHHQKKKLHKNKVAISNQLKGILDLFLYNTLVRKIGLQSKDVSNQYYFDTRRSC